jgi:hypothetical protein
LVGLLAIASSAPAAPTPKCVDSQEGDVAIRESTVVVKRPAKLTVTRRQTRHLVSDEETVTITIVRGSKTIATFAVAFELDKSVVATHTYGRGFKGIGTMTLRHGPAGDSLVVDGRAVSIVALTADPPSLVFEDGGAVPKLRVKRSLKGVLRRASALAELPCPAAAASTTRGSGFNDPFEDECETCYTGCWAEMLGCSALTVGTGSALSFVNSNWGCGGSLKRCVNACNSVGHECCRAFCGTTCCGRTVKAEEKVCLNAGPNFAGTCCATSQACGDKCCGFRSDLQGHYPQVCKDAGQSICCDVSASVCGAGCCAAGLTCAPQPLNPDTKVCCSGEPCGARCCQPGERCANPSDDFDVDGCITCPADKTGPVCGDTCCAASEVCGFGNECCTEDKLCGGTCCANMANCLNGTECCEPPRNVPCGGTCCAGIVTADCCNGQCCPGPCVGGGLVCCPSVQRACGNECCPLNYECQSQQCIPCGCPDGTECCSGGTTPCCTPPNVCCQPEGKPKGCYAINDCLNLH